MLAGQLQYHFRADYAADLGITLPSAPVEEITPLDYYGVLMGGRQSNLVNVGNNQTFNGGFGLDQILVSGTNDILNVSSCIVDGLNGSSFNVAGGNDALGLGSSCNLSLSGEPGYVVNASGDIINTTGGTSVTITGNNDVGNGTAGSTLGFDGAGESADGSGMTVYADTSTTSVSVTGNNNAVGGAAGSTIGFNGSGEVVSGSNMTVFATTSGTSVTVKGNNNSVGGVTGSTVGFDGTGGLVNGSNMTVFATTSGSSVTIMGNNDLVGGVAGSTVGFNGSGEVVNASNVVVNANVSGTGITVNGDNNIINGVSGASVTVNGSNGSSVVYQFNPTGTVSESQQAFSGSSGTGTHTSSSFLYGNGTSTMLQYNPSAGISESLLNYNADGTLGSEIVNYTNGTSSYDTYNPSGSVSDSHAYSVGVTIAAYGGYSLPAQSVSSSQGSGYSAFSNLTDSLGSFILFNFFTWSFDMAAGPLATSTAGSNVAAQYSQSLGNGAAASVAQADWADSFSAPSSPYEGAKWSNTTITWSLADAPSDQASAPYSGYISGSYASQIAQAMNAWGQASGLTFVEVADSSTADVRVGWGTFNPTQTGVLGLTSFNANAGTLQAGVTVRLEDPTEDALVTGPNGQAEYAGTNASLYQVALHEIGHALGLADSPDPHSIMYYAASASDATLDQTDINNIQTLYSSGFTPEDAMIAHATSTFSPSLTVPVVTAPNVSGNGGSIFLLPGGTDVSRIGTAPTTLQGTPMPTVRCTLTGKDQRRARAPTSLPRATETRRGWPAGACLSARQVGPL